jgi:hypothetical protein
VPTETDERWLEAATGVEVEFDSAVPEVTSKVSGAVIRPARGSREFDDWLDWMDSQRRGGSAPLPERTGLAPG